MGHMVDRCRTDIGSVLFFVSFAARSHANTIETYLQQSYTIEGRVLLHSIFPQILLLLDRPGFAVPLALSYLSRQMQQTWCIIGKYYTHNNNTKYLCKNYDGG